MRCTKVAKIGISDHFPTIAVFKDSFGNKQTHTSIKYRCYKNFDDDKFLNDLENAPWEEIESIENVDEALEYWYKLFLKITNKHAPMKEKRVKRNKQPEWFNDDILKQMAIRDHFKQKGEEERYRVARNRTVDMIDKAKTDYYSTMIEANKNNSKKLWGYMDEIAPKEKKQPPTSIIDGDKNMTDPQDIANSFNGFFATIVNKYLPESQNTPSDHTLLKDFVKSKLNHLDNFSIPLITEEEVMKLIGNLGENKATGLDGVSAKLLRLAAPVLCKTVTNILNLSISTGQFPSTWKLGKVTPIHKSGNRSDQNNFRPITILCALSKILEKHVHNYFYKFLLDHCLLYIAQSGFRAMHSCETALTRLVDMWTSNMEKGLLNGIILLDLRKAFDLVNTDVLLEKLKIYQCDERTLNWFKSYLQGRTQCVQFKGKISDTIPMTHGVPQGSILGPLLFILFMNDLPLHVDSELDMYADDSTLCATGETVEELDLKLNDDMDCVNDWCNDNHMVGNSDKTKAMLITTYQKEAKLPKKELTIFFQHMQLKNVNSEKLLGVKIDKYLTWKDHVNKTAKTISRNLALLR